MKWIREIRFGMPKQYKTGAVVSTYPKPMLVLLFEEGGLDVVQQHIVYIKPTDLDTLLLKEPKDLPPIVAIDFCDTSIKLITGIYQAAGNKAGFDAVIEVINKLLMAPKLPFRSVVLDSITQLSETILCHIAATQAAAMADARKWAGNIGLKVAQMMGSMNSLPCHIVYIMHAETQQNELTNEITILPLVHSKLRNKIGALCSQMLFATKQGQKAVVWTTDQGFVKGIGCRWPANLKPIVDADFTSIYGKDVQ